MFQLFVGNDNNLLNRFAWIVGPMPTWTYTIKYIVVTHIIESMYWFAHIECVCLSYQCIACGVLLYVFYVWVIQISEEKWTQFFSNQNSNCYVNFYLTKIDIRYKYSASSKCCCYCWRFPFQFNFIENFLMRAFKMVSILLVNCFK